MFDEPMRPELEALFLWIVLLAGPIALGMLLGAVTRALVRRRTGGLATLIVFLVLPTGVGVAAAMTHPILGSWDGGLEGLLLGLGFCATAHRAFSDPRAIVMVAASFTGSLLVAEGAVRLLPPPPGYSIEEKGFFLNPMPRFEDPMFGGAANRVCAIAYPGLYRNRLFNDPSISDLPVRRGDTSGPQEVRRRVLHIGDSMTYGFNVADDETFEAWLGRMEPGVLHINAAIVGTGPDDYLIVLRRWLAESSVDLVVISLFEGNDLSEIDRGHQCSNWGPILAYPPSGARLRFPAGPHEYRPLWDLVRGRSPPPYLVRALVGRSRIATLLAVAMSLRRPDINAQEPDEARWVHLDAILRAAKADLAARKIPLVIVVLPLLKEPPVPDAGPIETRMVATVRAAGIPVLDAGPLLRGLAMQGVSVHRENDTHFNPEGHRLLAEWLHRELPEASGLGPLRQPGP